jgi:hypothetical protein
MSRRNGMRTSIGLRLPSVSYGRARDRAPMGQVQVVPFTVKAVGAVLVPV